MPSIIVIDVWVSDVILVKSIYLGEITLAYDYS